MGRKDDLAPLRTWVDEPLSREVAKSIERLRRMDDVVAVAVMPDVHLAGAVCVGTVLATRSTVIPGAVGGDLGCGMTALSFDIGADALDDDTRAGRMLSLLGRRIPVAAHPSGNADLTKRLADAPLSTPALEKKKRTIGRLQFATLGRGNHFVEFQRDPEGRLWLLLHSGSRGLGQAVRDRHAGARDRLKSLEAESPEGSAFVTDMAFALEYAGASRRMMAEAVAGCVRELFGVQALWDSFVDCPHNFVRRERHGDEDLWVHRKGAISAEEGEPGIIPGSMGAPSHHVTGRGNADSLRSSSHGAGRVLSRADARRRVTAGDLLERMKGIRFDRRLTERLRDEAPAAYKDIGAVMRAQRDLTRIVRRLEPLLVYKGA